MLNDAILEAAYRAIRGTLAVEDRPGYCLKTVRQIIEDGLDLAPGDFYRLWVYPNFHLRPDETPEDIKPYWARGAERALRNAGQAVRSIEDAKPGDLVFCYRVSKPYGHVGILLDGKLILENTYALNRGWKRDGLKAIRITPMRQWDPITTVIRLRLPEGGNAGQV